MPEKRFGVTSRKDSLPCKIDYSTAPHWMASLPPGAAEVYSAISRRVSALGKGRRLRKLVEKQGKLSR